MPENRGNAVAYSGARTHRPLPSATDKSYRSTHQPQRPKKTSTFDWDWNKTACTSCSTKVAKTSIVDGLCRACRGEPEAPRQQHTAPREAYAPYDDAELDTLYHPDHPLPEVDVDQELAVEPVQMEADDSAVDESLRPAPEPEPEPAATPPPAGPRRPLDQVDLLEESIQHAERTIRAAHGITDPIVGTLRTAALSAIAALDFYLALHHTTTDPRGTVDPSTGPPTGPPTDGAASQTHPASPPGGDRPAARTRGEARQRPARSRGVRQPAVAVDESAVVLEYAAGDTCPTIARRHGVLPKRIRQILLAHGVQLRDDRRGHSGGRKRVEDDHALNQQVCVLYVEQRLSTLEVAERLHIGRKRVTRILETLGVPLRPAAHLAHPDLSEQDVARAVELYLAGESLAEVGAQYGVRAAAIRDFVVRAGHPIRAKGASQEIAERLRELGITAAQVKEWAVETGLVATRPAGIVGRSLIDAYVAAHQPEGAPT